MTIKWRARWMHYTSWMLLPTIRVGSTFCFFTWLKFDAGFRLEKSR